jgi:hypothetical protein
MAALHGVIHHQKITPHQAFATNRVDLASGEKMGKP